MAYLGSYFQDVVTYWSTPVDSLENTLMQAANAILGGCIDRIVALGQQTKAANFALDDAQAKLDSFNANIPAISGPEDDPDGSIQAAIDQSNQEQADINDQRGKIASVNRDIVKINNSIALIRSGSISYALQGTKDIIANVQLENVAPSQLAATADANADVGTGMSGLGEPFTVGIGMIVALGILLAIVATIALEANAISSRVSGMTTPVITSMTGQAAALTEQANEAAASGDTATAAQLNQQAANLNNQAAALAKSAAASGGVGSGISQALMPIALVIAAIIVLPPLIKMMSDRRTGAASS